MIDPSSKNPPFETDLPRALSPPIPSVLVPLKKEAIVNVSKAKSIKGFRRIIQGLRKEAGKDRLIFRGETSCSEEGELRTSLQKFLDSTCGAVTVTRIEAENIALREFKRNYHRYSQYIPRDDDRLEWLATMQHHGAPTRLLDWTFSEYVALFFAIRRACPNAKRVHHVVWVVNQTAHWNAFKEMVEDFCPRFGEQLEKDDKDREITTWALTKCSKTMAVPLNPFRQNARLHVQQGTFMAALNLNESFQVNVAGLPNPKVPLHKIIITVSADFLVEALTELQRINITDKSLFPDIDGLAKSTELSILLRHLHPPK